MTENIKSFLSRLGEMRAGYAFRGQENKKWELESSALRRIAQLMLDQPVLDSRNFNRVLIAYHQEELLYPARTAGFGIDDGRELSDLELLAKLQHFGAATALLDFTWNPLVALWFACQPTKELICVPKDDGTCERKFQESSGMVFAVNLNDRQHFSSIPYEKVGEKTPIENLLSTRESETPHYWEPIAQGDADARIIAQSSVFVIGRPIISGDLVRTFEIDADKKALLRGELAEHLGVSDVSLFRDLSGFSSVNGYKSPIRRTLQPETAFSRAQRLHQIGDYGKAIEYYDQCIEQVRDVAEVYFCRANAKASLKRHEEACEDYDRAERCKRLFWHVQVDGSSQTAKSWAVLLFNRANSRAILGRYEKALEDLTEAKSAIPRDDWLARVSFNRANVLARLHRLQEAVTDYETTIASCMRHQRVFANAQFNLGNTLVMRGRLSEARTAFKRSAAAPKASRYAESNAACVKRVLAQIGKLEIESVRTSPSAPTGKPIEKIEIVIAGKERAGESIPFAGNVGNIGNRGGFFSGGMGIPGGEGHPGGSSYFVLVRRAG